MSKTQAQLIVNDAVYVARSSSYGVRHSKGIVTKITPAGYVDVTMGGGTVVRFNKEGRTNHEHYKNHWLELDVEAVESRAATKANAIVAIAAIREVKYESHLSPEHVGKESLERIVAELQSRLDAAKAAVANI